MVLLLLGLGFFGVIFSVIANTTTWLYTTGNAYASINLWQECAAFSNIQAPGSCPSGVSAARVFSIFALTFGSVVSGALPFFVFGQMRRKAFIIALYSCAAVASFSYLVAFAAFSPVSTPTQDIVGVSTVKGGGFAMAVLNFLLYGTVAAFVFLNRSKN